MFNSTTRRIIFLTLFALAVCFTWVTGYNDDVRFSQLEHRTIKGVITSITPSSGRGRTHYTTSFQFTVNGKTYKGQTNSIYQADQTGIGLPITVTYAVHDPSDFRLGSWEFSPSLVSNVEEVAIIFMFVSAVPIIAFCIDWQYRLRFHRNGRLIFGKITHVSDYFEKVPWYARGRSDPSENYHVAITYEFEPSREKCIQSELNQIRNDLIGCKLPAVGTPIAIAYINEKDYLLM